jgi:hypothetical protein
MGNLFAWWLHIKSGQSYGCNPNSVLADAKFKMAFFSFGGKVWLINVVSVDLKLGG